MSEGINQLPDEFSSAPDGALRWNVVLFYLGRLFMGVVSPLWQRLF